MTDRTYHLLSHSLSNSILNRAYPAVLLTQLSDTTHSMIGYKYLLAAV